MKKRIEKMRLIYTLLILFVMPPAILSISQLITLQSAKALFWWTEHAGPFFFGWGALLGVCGLLYGLTGRLWSTWLLTAVPGTVLSLIHVYKLELHGLPLGIGDFSLAGQLGMIAEFALPYLEVSACTVAALLLTAVFPVCMGIFERKTRWLTRFRFAVGIVGALLSVLVIFCIPGTALVEKLDDGAADQSERADRCGVLVGLYCAWAGGGSEPAYDMAQIEEDLNIFREQEGEKSGNTPSVIFLMSESFFDVTDLPNLSFESDPIPNFHAIEENATSGKFVSSTYCGGTGYVEMEVLTGLCGYLLEGSDTLTSLPKKTYAALPCITDVFTQSGYRKEFLHSHTDELYNRPVIYKALGFDSIRFSDSFPKNVQTSGGYISDMALTEEIISIYENRGEQPLMLYAVSMENHQPYSADKYSTSSGAGVSSVLLDQDELAVVDSLVHGLSNADRALGRLVEYFSACEEDVMIVFWGDHLPNLKLPDGKTAYEKLGLCSTSATAELTTEEIMDVLTTDYVIWTNYGLAEKDAVSSSTLLGLNVLEQLDLPLTDYYLWLKGRLSNQYLMYRSRLFVDETGKEYTSIPEERTDVMDYYASVVYHIVYGSDPPFTQHRNN